jgi:hypothetical protein
MTIEQIVDIPDDRRITLNVPQAVPTGKTILTFTPASSRDVENSPRTTAEAIQMAEAKAADPNRKPLSHYFGILSPEAFGDAVAYQRSLRDEWDD